MLFHAKSGIGNKISRGNYFATHNKFSNSSASTKVESAHAGLVCQGLRGSFIKGKESCESAKKTFAYHVLNDKRENGSAIDSAD